MSVINYVAINGDEEDKTNLTKENVKTIRITNKRYNDIFAKTEGITIFNSKLIIYSNNNYLF